MAFTKEQQLAIDTTGKDILVSAAAGSGKTTILVERIIKMLLDEDNPATIDTILVVTFSKAATAEMRKRISDAFTKAVNENPKSKYLRNQLSMINRASITTLDSFFQSVVKKYFRNVDIDPNFRIGDTAELNLLSNQVLNDYFEELYQKEDKEFLYLVDTYSSKPTDNALENLILEISKKTETVISIEKWFEKSINNFNITSVEEYFNSDIFINIKSKGLKIVEECEKYIEEIKNVHENLGAKLPKFLNDDIEIITNIKDLIKNERNQELFDYMQQLLRPRFFTQGRLAKLSDDGKISQALKYYRDTYKDMLCEYADFFAKTPKQYLEEYSYLYKISKKLAELTLTYNKRFFELKKEKSIFGFSDITHLCLQILIDENGNPTTAAQEYQKKFNEIIVDEFQDSNFIQDSILTAISRKSQGKPNMFMVGDLKQCIYKFRSSDPTMFNNKYNRFKNNTDNTETRIDLNKNFRSRQCIVDCINFIFKQIMSIDIGEVNYDEYAMLYAGADYPDPEDTNINYSQNCEFHVLNSHIVNSDDFDEKYSNGIDELNEYQNAELEATFIANRINELIFDEKIQVYDNKQNTYRPAQYRDFVILMRGTKKFATTFTSILSDNSIPSFCSNGAGFFNVIEVKTILSLLAVIDNPYQDIELIAVLHSPMYSLSADELLEIRLFTKNSFFYSAIKNFIENNNENEELKNKLVSFLNDLKRWLAISATTPISEFLYILYSETNYYNYIGMLGNGEIRQANLDNLCEKAKSFEAAGFNGLFKFISFIESIKTNSKDMESSISSEAENLVQIMTIHKSKGLEFPFVFVTMLGSKFNLNEIKSKFLIHNNLGFAPKINKILTLEDLTENEIKLLGDISPKITYKSQYFNYVADKIKNEQFSEEMRILYVALTRAKEKLILIGTCDLEAKAFSKKFMSIIPTKYELYPNSLGDNYLDWILKALSRHPDNNCFKISYENTYSFNNIFQNEKSRFNFSTIDRNELTINKIETDIKLEECFKKFENLDNTVDYSGYKDEIFSVLSYKYPYEIDLALPSTVSISEIKRNHQNEFIPDKSENIIIPSEKQNDENTDFPLPEFYSADKLNTTGVFKGTALHTVMEHIDFNMKTIDEVNLMINDLREKNIISEEQFKTVNAKKIVTFLNSELCDRIRNSTNVFRETPFVMGLNPNEVYNDKDLSASDSTILVHGIIDLCFEEGDDIILVDYKTDKVKNIEDIKQKYKIQLALYKKILEKNTNKIVKESILYLFNIDKIINL